jgi:hypothetical protein
MKRLGAILRRPLSAVAVAGLLVAGASAYALASPRHPSRTISACVSHRTGTFYSASHCKSHDHKLTWNVTGPQGPAGAQYVWSGWAYPHGAQPQSNGEVASFTFSAPKAGFVLATTQFQVRVKNDGTDDCHIESQLASAPAVLGIVQPTEGQPGFVDNWVNANLPTEDGGGTYLGLNMSTSRVFPVVAGSNTIYLNGQYDGYGTDQANCQSALWGPITISAVFANSNPTSALSVP